MLFSQDASILLIEPSSPKRSLEVSVFKDKNLGSVQGVASAQDAVSILEVEKVSWIICPIMADQEVNGFSLLQLVLKQPILKNLRVSFFVDDEQLPLLPSAYERGLLCHFSYQHNKESLSQEIDSFIAIADSVEKQQVKISAEYLKQYFISNKNYKPILSLDKKLLDIFPKDISLLQSLGKAYYHCKELDDAKNTLIQTFLLDQNFPEDCVEIAKELDIDLEALKNSDGSELPEGMRPLSIPDCVVISPLDDLRANFAKILIPLGLEKLIEYTDGEGAVNAIENQKQPSLLFMGWIIPKLTGPALLQSIKVKFPSLPIVVYGDDFLDEDAELMKEMGVTAIVPSAFNRSELIETILYVIRQETQPSEAVFMENKIRQLIKDKKIDKAREIHSSYQEMGQIPKSRKKMMEAEFCYIDGDFLRSRDLTIEAIRSGLDSVILLNHLGKCFIKLEDHESALKCFDKAQELSPKNIERLCTIALVNQEIGKKEETEGAIDEAKKIDENSEQVKETESAVSILDGNIKAAKEIMKGLQSLTTLVAFMNNQAIALAKSSKVKESLEGYQRTLDSIPVEKVEIKATVTFNMAFAYLRHDEIQDAKKFFEKVLTYGKTRVQEKTNRILQKIEMAERSGKDIKLSTGQKEQEVKVDNQEDVDAENISKIRRSEILAKITIKPGDICCFGVFENPEEDSAEIKKLIGKVPLFNPRENISRGETGGLEKSLKNA